MGSNIAHAEWRHMFCYALIGWIEGTDGPNYYNPFVLIPYLDYEDYNDIQKPF